MKEIISFLLSFIRPEFIDLARNTNCVQAFDDDGDLVIVFRIGKKNPHDLVHPCIRILGEMLKGSMLYTDKKGRLVLSYVVKEGKVKK